MNESELFQGMRNGEAGEPEWHPNRMIVGGDDARAALRFARRHRSIRVCSWCTTKELRAGLEKVAECSHGACDACTAAAKAEHEKARAA